MASYFIYNFKIVIDNNSIPLLFETNKNEIFSFLSMELIVWCGLSLVISFILICVFIRCTKKRSGAENFKYFIFSLIFIISFGYYSESSKVLKYMPLNYLSTSLNYLVNKLTPVEKFDISTIDANKEGQEITVVMLIGESARPDHFSLNGYERQTNPKLSKIPNLVNFKDVSSCSNKTHISLPCMLTRATSVNTDLYKKETSVISVFESLGFDTFWVDNQYFKGDVTGTSRIINEADSKINAYLSKDAGVADAKILPIVDDIIEKHKGNTLIVVQTLGSHWNYDFVYDDKHKIYTPTCKDYVTKNKQVNLEHCSEANIFSSSCLFSYKPHDCEISTLINSYDNSILYSDFVISELIDKLKDRNSILFYSSDHGELLGENGLFIHGQNIPAPEQYKVATFIWASDEYKKSNPNKFMNMLSRVEDELTHDIIFHSLLGCSGVESEVIDDSLNICKKHPDNK
jgi:lipid A ethanolaminephosphotransferase